MNVICEYRDPAGILEKYFAVRIETEIMVVEAGIPLLFINHKDINSNLAVFCT